MAAKRPSAAQFVALLEQWNIPFQLNDGWEIRSHNDKQPPRDLEFIVIHHTGDDAPDDKDLSVLINGRTDLPGPIATVGISDDGVVHPVSLGTSYQAGEGSSAVLHAIQAGGNPPPPGPDDTNGNPISWGWETMYSGLHAPTGAAYQTLATLTAAVCWLFGWYANRVIGHKEWTKRKIDPGYINMWSFRSEVQRRINAGPPAPPQHSGIGQQQGQQGKDWFDMATPAELQQAVTAGITAIGNDMVPSTEFRAELLQLNPQDLPRVLLATARAAIDANHALAAANTRLDAMADQLGKLQALVAELRPAGGTASGS